MKIRDLHKNTEEGVPKVETGADQMALGVQVNWKGAGVALWRKLLVK